MARGRWGERGADYNPPIGRAIRNAESFSIQAKGYSFTFAHNFRGWKTFTDDIKKKMLEAALAEIKSTVREVGRGAIARAPHYSGALEHSIKVSVPEITSLKGRGRITAIVGVLDSWHSSYDKIAAAGGYPTSSPELIAYIHDYYDDFIGETKDGLKRKHSINRIFRQPLVNVSVADSLLVLGMTSNRAIILQKVLQNDFSVITKTCRKMRLMLCLNVQRIR